MFTLPMLAKLLHSPRRQPLLLSFRSGILGRGRGGEGEGGGGIAPDGLLGLGGLHGGRGGLGEERGGRGGDHGQACVRWLYCRCGACQPDVPF
eukprot:6451833-Prymnesium_polylepis.1